MATFAKLKGNPTTTATSKEIQSGRYVGTITQLVNAGMHAAYNDGDPAQLTFAINVHFDGADIAKKLTANVHPKSTLSQVLYAAGLTLEDDINDLLGKNVVIHVNGGRYASITEFEPLEEFDTPIEYTGHTLCLEKISGLTQEAANLMTPGVRKIRNDRDRRLDAQADSEI